MENLTRMREAAVVAAIVTTAAVAIARVIGVVIVAAFLAGAGTGMAVGYR
jgi:hypothetical protein